MKDRTLRYDVAVGNMVGSWKILKKLKGEHWECQCLTCGTKREMTTTQLKFGTSLQCKECFDKSQSTPKYDMTGLTVGNVKVLKPVKGGSWECLCSCNRIINVKGFNLRKAIDENKNYMCAQCSYEVKRDKLEGTTINDWTILRYKGNGLYECKCSCSDKIHIRSGKSIKSGASKSCGCKLGENLRTSMMQKYGEVASNRIQNPREKWQIEAIESKENLTKFIESNGYYGISLIELANIIGIKPVMMGRIIHKYFIEDLVTLNQMRSQDERDLYEFVRSVTDSEVLHSCKNVIPPYELDIYIPDKNIAIEFNENYWNSDMVKDVKYHQMKSILCGKKGIRLIHVFEYEWSDLVKQTKIKNLITQVIGNNTRIYAKNTSIKEIGALDKSNFLNKYHLQGDTASSINLGCYFEGELIGVMTFGKPRFTGKYEYEIIRLCWKTGLIVVGGVEKLFKYFVNNYTPNSIISYSDLSKFTGNTYIKLGFKFNKSDLTEPNYVWVNCGTGEVKSRYQTQKHKLVENGLDTYGDTESEIMYNLGYVRVYDSGNLRFIWNSK